MSAEINFQGLREYCYFSILEQSSSMHFLIKTHLYENINSLITTRSRYSGTDYLLINCKFKLGFIKSSGAFHIHHFEKKLCFFRFNIHSLSCCWAQKNEIVLSEIFFLIRKSCSMLRVENSQTSRIFKILCRVASVKDSSEREEKSCCFLKEERTKLFSFCFVL